MPPLGNPSAISYSRSSARSDLKTFTFPLASYNFRMRAICDVSDIRTFLRLKLMAHSSLGLMLDKCPQLLVLRVHEHSPEGTVLDQIADCFGRLGHGEDFADCGLQRAFLEVRQQRRIGCRHRLRGEESEGEPADRRSLPDDVGDVDFRPASPGITGDDQCAAKGKRRQRSTGQTSADAIDDDIYALASGDAQGRP